MSKKMTNVFYASSFAGIPINKVIYAKYSLNFKQKFPGISEILAGICTVSKLWLIIGQIFARECLTLMLSRG